MTSFVRVQFENELLDTMIDRFGKSGAQYAPVDDEHFEITAQVRVSDMFFSWVCGFGKRAKIVYPEHIIDEFAAFLDGIKVFINLIQTCKRCIKVKRESQES